MYCLSRWHSVPAVGLRNSRDKSFPIGIAFGSRVFVCDSLTFVGDQGQARTAGAGGGDRAPLQQQRVAQNHMLLTYQGMPVSNAVADEVIMQLFRKEVIGCSALLTWWSSGNVPPMIGATDGLAVVQYRDLCPCGEGYRERPAALNSNPHPRKCRLSLMTRSDFSAYYARDEQRG
jgi:hypothetical protein